MERWKVLPEMYEIRYLAIANFELFHPDGGICLGNQINQSFLSQMHVLEA